MYTASNKLCTYRIGHLYGSVPEFLPRTGKPLVDRKEDGGRFCSSNEIASLVGKELDWDGRVLSGQESGRRRL
jgi:hypothetical protein